MHFRLILLICLVRVDLLFGWSNKHGNDDSLRRRKFFRRITTEGGGLATILAIPWLEHDIAAASTTTMTMASNTGTSTSSRTSLTPPLIERLDASTLLQPPTLMGDAPTSMKGVDNTIFPDFLAGTWQVTQKLVNVSTPLGIKYLGGPNGVPSIAEATLKETNSKRNEPVTLQLRFVPSTTAGGVVEDRAFNTKQRLNNFAGRAVVASVDYADVQLSNRQAVLKNGGTMEDPLQTIIVRYKGPAAQKIFVTSHSTTTTSTSVDNNDDDSVSSKQVWFVSEGQRSIFALTNENTAPPIITDSELLWRIEPPSRKDGLSQIHAKLRIASYLNPQSDKLYFETKNSAVSFLDYTLVFKPIS